MSKELCVLIESFLDNLLYVQSYIFENFGKEQILANKNQGRILSRNYSIKNSRIKGYTFHGYGCLFQFKDSHIDIDLRFDKVSFTAGGLSAYLKAHGIEMSIEEIQKLLKSQICLKKLQAINEEFYFL